MYNFLLIGGVLAFVSFGVMYLLLCWCAGVFMWVSLVYEDDYVSALCGGLALLFLISIAFIYVGSVV